MVTMIFALGFFFFWSCSSVANGRGMHQGKHQTIVIHSAGQTLRVIWSMTQSLYSKEQKFVRKKKAGNANNNINKLFFFFFWSICVRKQKFSCQFRHFEGGLAHAFRKNITITRAIHLSYSWTHLFLPIYCHFNNSEGQSFNCFQSTSCLSIAILPPH